VRSRRGRRAENLAFGAGDDPSEVEMSQSWWTATTGGGDDDGAAPQA
jgi:hypothetical protein